MDRRAFLVASTAALLPFQARADICRDGAANAADIRWLLGQIAANYAYLPDRKVDLQKVRALYEPQAAAVCDAHAFLNVLERLLAEFHDHHMEPGVNNAHSPQLVPSGTDIWASMHAGRARIEQVRPGSAAARAGVRNGDEIVSIGGASAADAVAAHAPRCLSEPDPEAANYTLRVLLAGTHDAPRKFAVRTNGGAIRAIELPPFQQQPARAPLAIRRLDDILCLRIENSLGDLNLIPAVDAALDALGDAKALILDLRNTPSGGTTDVAEPILGRFITGRPNYQRVFKPGPGKRFPQDSTLRWVRTRGRTITLPIAILVDRWTGSMGEGMAIGFDGLKRATVVGTRMAGLCGATQMFTLPASGIGVRMPVERLYHLDDTPRESWLPPAFVDLGHEAGADPILTRAVEILRS